MVNTLGANRVMYGSDLIANVPVMLTLVRSIGLSADDEAMVLGGTAKEIFGLDV
jgi:predicted TIM-barrel fold metal-dependent hydrolase